jgi:aspartyl-tRNA(Asn)/glutamyl-tRNA(Gln) amidotransferase subunit B
LYKIFNYVYEQTKDYEATITWVIVELKNLYDENFHYSNVQKNIIEQTIILIKYLQSQKINGKQAKQIFSQLLTNKTIDELITKLNIKEVSDNSIIEKILLDAIDNNQEIVKQYKERKERVEKFLMGIIMKETKGQANPIIAKNILSKLLKKYE